MLTCIALSKERPPPKVNGPLPENKTRPTVVPDDPADALPPETPVKLTLPLNEDCW